MNNKIFTLFVAMALAAFMLLVSFSGARWYEAGREKPLVYTQEPYLTDADNLSRLSYEPGKSVIIQVWGRRNRSDCWGNFTTVIAGPVAYSFASVPALILNDQPADYNLRLLFQLPNDLPEGVYKWRRIYAPTCDAVDLKPYELEMFDLTMKVEKKK
jgi:hypothetical protein